MISSQRNTNQWQYFFSLEEYCYTKKYYLDFQSYIDWAEDLHYQAVNRQYNQFCSTPDMYKPWQIIPFGAFTHSKHCQLQAHIFIWFVWSWTQKGFTPEFTNTSCFSTLLCMAGTPAAAAKGSTWVLPLGNGGAGEGGGRSAYGALFWRGDRREGQHNISWSFT